MNDAHSVGQSMPANMTLFMRCHLMMQHSQLLEMSLEMRANNLWMFATVSCLSLHALLVFSVKVLPTSLVWRRKTKETDKPVCLFAFPCVCLVFALQSGWHLTQLLAVLHIYMTTGTSTSHDCTTHTYTDSTKQYKAKTPPAPSAACFDHCASRLL